MIAVTLLCENTARGMGVLGEHGLAWWIDTGTHRVLFDTGQGLTLTHNAVELGIDLARADAIALSHGHHDHVGGLEAALAKAPEAALFFHPRATEAKFSGSDGKPQARRISRAFFEREAFRRGGLRVEAARGPREIVPGIWLTGEIPRTNDYEDTGGPFFLDAAMTHPDPLVDDQAVFFTAAEGVVVVLGCAHAGVVNTLDYVAKLTGHATIHTVIGGMHLERASPRRMEETFAALRRLDVQRIGPAHCTGARATAEFWRRFPVHCLACGVGLRLQFHRQDESSSARG